MAASQSERLSIRHNVVLTLLASHIRPTEVNCDSSLSSVIIFAPKGEFLAVDSQLHLGTLCDKPVLFYYHVCTIAKCQMNNMLQ